MRDLYMKTGHGFLLVYSITAQASIQDLDDMYKQIKQVKDDDVPIMLACYDWPRFPGNDSFFVAPCYSWGSDCIAHGNPIVVDIICENKGHPDGHISVEMDFRGPSYEMKHLGDGTVCNGGACTGVSNVCCKGTKPSLIMKEVGIFKNSGNIIGKTILQCAWEEYKEVGSCPDAVKMLHKKFW